MKFGRLWAETQHVVSRHLDLVLPVAGLFLFLPQLLMARQIGDRTAEQIFDGGVKPELLIYPLVLVAGLLGQLPLYVIAWHDGTDGRRLGDVLLLSGKRLLPAVAASLLQGIAMGAMLIPAAILVGMLGLPMQLAPLMLIVPALWIYSRFVPALPLLMAETRDPLVAVQQSWRLTRGRSLRILASVLTLLFGLLLVLTAFNGLAKALGVLTTVAAGRPMQGWGVGRWLFELVSTAVSVVFSIYFVCFVARLSKALKVANAG